MTRIPHAEEPATMFYNLPHVDRLDLLLTTQAKGSLPPSAFRCSHLTFLGQVTSPTINYNAVNRAKLITVCV